MIARATMGKGSFVVGGEDYEGNINRNIASFQVITRDKSLGGFDVSVNVDHRLFSKEGRQEWKAEKKQEVENFKNVGENVKVASWRVGKSATDLGRAIESGLTNEDVSVLEIGKLYGEAVDRNVNAQKDHKNLVIRDKMNDALGEKGEKSAEDVQTDLRDVANIMREREGAEEGDLYLYEGDELTAENEFDKKGISKKQAKAYHDADNSDIAINVDKTDLTKGAELYGTITEEAVHAGQKARGEVYDSEDGIGGRSEGLAEFANKTASSAWELENKIAGISNESNSLQMDNWRTDNSSSETMLIGLGKAENAQDVQPEVLDVTRGLNIPVVKKFVNHGFLVVVPDNPEDFTGDKFGALGLENLPAMQDVGNGKKGWVLGAHNKEGSLVVIPNQEQDLEATPQALDYLNGKTKEVTWGNLKTNIPDNGSWNTDIRTVDFGDKTDTEAITDILRNTDNYISNTESNPVNYGTSPKINKFIKERSDFLDEFFGDYNCNSWKNGNLKEAGATNFDNDFNGIDVGEEILVPGEKFNMPE